jgi:energy-coupling factor transporter ATP-binding protein EcfA2
MNLIRECNQALRMTVVMVTHERALAEQYVQRLIFLADGKVVDDQANGSALAATAPQGGDVREGL